MSATVRFHANAQRDLDRALLWYHEEAPELVKRQIIEVIAVAHNRQDPVPLRDRLYPL